MGESDLPTRLRVLVRLSGAVASGRGPALSESLEEAYEHGIPEEVEEALVQSHLFVGFPAALGALARWREVSRRPPPEARADDPGTRAERGAAVCRRVYGDQYEPLRRNISGLHPDLDRWMVEDGYGKVLARPGLSLQDRELCVAAMLAVQGARAQLHSHLRGALRTGASPEAVQAALEAVAFLMDGETESMTWHTWEGVRRRQAAGPERTSELERD
jgi:4-carboxymuconolactone decarboxylase